jgi:hypothetical protein
MSTIFYIRAFHTLPDRYRTDTGTDMSPELLAFLSQVCEKFVTPKRVFQISSPIKATTIPFDIRSPFYRIYMILFYIAGLFSSGSRVYSGEKYFRSSKIIHHCKGNSKFLYGCITFCFFSSEVIYNPAPFDSFTIC